MSANNKLKIIKGCNNFIVRNIDVDTGYEYDVATTDTLEKAIKKANKWAEENECEYGLDIKIE